MADRLSQSSVKELAVEAMYAGKKLLPLPSSSAEIVNILIQMEQILHRVQQCQSRSAIKALNPIIEALIAKELLRHPDMDVNILVVCCICDVLMIVTPYNHEQMKEFFELVVVTFEKLSAKSGGCYTRMIKVLETIGSVKFLELMADCLHLDGLIVRLFKQFLAVADSNSPAVVSKMEKILTMLIEESKAFPDELVGILATCVKKENQTDLSLGEKVLKKCADRLKPRPPDKRLKRCLHSQSEPKHESVSPPSIETPMPSNSIREWNGKRKIKNKQGRSVEHGENLVGKKIKVWWPADKMYYQGVVESFDGSKKKHKVSYDDGEVELLDLKGQKWELVENASSKSNCLKQEVTITVPSLPSGITSDQGHKVKNINAAIRESILKKQGGIAADCVLKTPAQSVEHGENLVGKRIKVLWPADKKYYEGVVKSFDSSKQRHKVLYDDGEFELLNLKWQKWELAENTSPSSDRELHAMPIVISSSPSGITCVRGYMVKNINAPILESIFKKHGDIAANCVFKTSSVKEPILEVVCDVVRKIQTNDVTTIISDMEEIESQVSAAEAIKINVSWLRAHLKAIHKKTEAKKKCSLLKKMTADTSLVMLAAKKDLKETRLELLAVQERIEKAERCVEVLNLVGKKLNNSFLESKAEKDSLVEPVL